MDYPSLRKEALDFLQRVAAAGGPWTDFNTHDPGVTLLEAICYVLTDLGHRTGHSIPDLLAGGGGDPYENLYPPAEILTSNAVTRLDLRKVALDVPGVRNVWADQTSDPHKGLYRVLIDAEPTAGRETVEREVTKRVHQHRNLGEDFEEIRVLEIEPVEVNAEIEISPGVDAGTVREKIWQQVGEHISPTIRRTTIEQAWRDGESVDEIFDGPVLRRGIIDSDELEQAQRRTALYTSDIIRVISDVPGVRVVKKINLSARSEKEGSTGRKTDKDKLTLTLDTKKCPGLDDASEITLLQNGVRLPPPLVPPSTRLHIARPVIGRDPLEPPRGRDRHVTTYSSVRYHLPALYGVADGGLPDDAPAERRGQANQLRAYLDFFDNPMRGYLGELARLRDLFAFDASPLHHAGEDQQDERAAIDRRMRFLDHLLARFAEQLAPDRTTEQKAAFLQSYPHLSAARGTGRDVYNESARGKRSALEERIALKLGLTEAEGEQLVLIEHVLLREVKTAERASLSPFRLPDGSDPYSLQVSFVLPMDEDPFRDPAFRERTERLLREEAPAHLIVYALWLSATDWSDFKARYPSWIYRPTPAVP